MKCDKEQCRHYNLESDGNCKRDNKRTFDCIKGWVNYFEINLNLIKIEHYQPSNGTEQMFFEDQFCEVCAKMGKDGNPPHCMIWGDMMTDTQRDEWCYVDKKPTCTAFQSSEDHEKELNQKKDDNLIKSGQTCF